MIEQRRSPFHARDREIALMPLAPEVRVVRLDLIILYAALALAPVVGLIIAVLAIGVK